jgi:hypothetical protein
MFRRAWISGLMSAFLALLSRISSHASSYLSDIAQLIGALFSVLICAQYAYIYAQIRLLQAHLFGREMGRGSLFCKQLMKQSIEKYMLRKRV